MTLIGSNPAAQSEGQQPLIGKSNYFLGKNPNSWIQNIPNFGRVVFRNIYPDIHLAYYGTGSGLEYDFRVAPGANPADIRMTFEGATDLHLDESGDLTIVTPEGEVRQRRPVFYQDADGLRKIVSGQYLLLHNREVAFLVRDFDRSKPLVIDPIIDYSTFIGAGDQANAIAVDSAGNAYITGQVGSPDLPTTPGAYQTIFSGGGFVSKLNPTGTALVYSTYIGGVSLGYGIAVDSSGNAYITGQTNSRSFPSTPSALQPFVRGCTDAFVLKLNATGSSLLYSTCLGGGDSGQPGYCDAEWGQSIAVDASGNVYVAGRAGSIDFPTTVGAYQSTFGGRLADAFVAKLNSTGTGLIYSTLLGGIEADHANAIAVDSSGRAYVTGITASSSFPRTRRTFRTSEGISGSGDLFVTGINATGSALFFSTYFGGTGAEVGQAIGLDSAGDVFVAGTTTSSDFPTTPGAIQSRSGGQDDAFILKLNPSGGLEFSTLLGGARNEAASGIMVEPSGTSFVTGYSTSANFPTTSGAIQTNLTSIYNAFVAKVSSTGISLMYSSLLGGNGGEQASALALDLSGNIFLTGFTFSTNFPITPGAFQTEKGSSGASSVFVTRLHFSPRITNALVTGKNLLVSGNDFEEGSVILLEGEAQKTANDDETPAALLIARKAGKRIPRGQAVRLRVRSPNGSLTPDFIFTRPLD